MPRADASSSLPIPVPLPPPAAPGTRRAVIDVGTNSVKLLVANVQRSVVEPVLERGTQTRLGEKFFATRRLQPEAIARTAVAAAEFRTQALDLGVEHLHAFATAAAREALNGDDLITAFRDHAGLELHVISGDREAELAFRGVCSHPAFARDPIVVMDLGGGSTEFIAGQAGVRCFGRSFPLGAVRLLESLHPPESPTPDDLRRCQDEIDTFLVRDVLPELYPALAGLRQECSPTLVGVGGTAVILARIVHGLVDYDRDRIEARPLDAATVRGVVDRLWSLPIARRREVPGLPPERADVMLTGALVYDRVLHALRLPGVSPCTRGLRFAALLDPP